MVTQQILNLLFKVRILVRQPLLPQAGQTKENGTCISRTQRAVLLKQGINNSGFGLRCCKDRGIQAGQAMGAGG